MTENGKNEEDFVKWFNKTIRNYKIADFISLSLIGVFLAAFIVVGIVKKESIAAVIADAVLIPASYLLFNFLTSSGKALTSYMEEIVRGSKEEGTSLAGHIEKKLSEIQVAKEKDETTAE